MKEAYIFAAMSVANRPPKGERPTSPGSNYVFAPLGGDSIYTLDADIWRAAGEHPETKFFPDSGEYGTILQKTLDQGNILLLGLTDKHELDIPGRGRTTLEKFTTHSTQKEIDAGYDVMDSFGLSAASNIGYTKPEAIAISSLNIKINKYGLIENEPAAIKFMQLAENYAKEHVPFYAINIKILNYCCPPFC